MKREDRHRGGHRIPLRVSKDGSNAPSHRSGMGEEYQKYVLVKEKILGLSTTCSETG
jgi:hypothetical protein